MPSECHIFVKIIFDFFPKTQSGLDDPGEETPKSNHKRSNSLGSETKEVHLTYSFRTLEKYFKLLSIIFAKLTKYFIE